MKIYLPVTWSVCGTVEIEADSIEEAIEYFYNHKNDIDIPYGTVIDETDFDLATDNIEWIEQYQ